MKAALLPLVVMLAALLSGCGGAPRIGHTVAEYDKFKDQTVELVRVGNTVELMALRDGNAPARYAFILEANSRGNESARPNEFIFLLDGQQMRLEGESELRDVYVFDRYNVIYRERAIFPVTASQLRRIADASTVEVRVYGENRSFAGANGTNHAGAPSASSTDSSCCGSGTG